MGTRRKYKKTGPLKETKAVPVSKDMYGFDRKNIPYSPPGDCKNYARTTDEGKISKDLNCQPQSLMISIIGNKYEYRRCLLAINTRDPEVPSDKLGGSFNFTIGRILI